jgi:hypothetical protein
VNKAALREEGRARVLAFFQSTRVERCSGIKARRQSVHDESAPAKEFDEVEASRPMQLTGK